MRARAAFAALVLLLVAASAGPASASGVDLGRAKGMELVGERADGYVGVVVPQPISAIEALVKRINAKRRAAYEAIARRTGATIGVVEVLAGQKLIERAAQGEWVTDADGVWREK